MDFSDEFGRFADFEAWLKKPGGLYQAAGSAMKIPQDAVAPTQACCGRISEGCASIRFLYEKLLARRPPGSRERSPWDENIDSHGRSPAD